MQCITLLQMKDDGDGARAWLNVKEKITAWKEFHPFDLVLECVMGPDVVLCDLWESGLIFFCSISVLLLFVNRYLITEQNVCIYRSRTLLFILHITIRIILCTSSHTHLPIHTLSYIHCVYMCM